MPSVASFKMNYTGIIKMEYMNILDKVNLPDQCTEGEKMKLHFFTLSFGGELERLFAKSIFENVKYFLQIRVILLLTIGFYSAFGFLDVLLVPDGYKSLFYIRFAVVLPCILLIILFSFTKIFERYVQLSFALITIVAGGGIVMMIVLTPPPATYSYYAGLILVFMFVYTFGRVRFIWATFAGWILILFYEISAVYFTDTPIPVLINNNFFFISANIIGMTSCYLLEYFDRRNFFITLQLENEKRKTKEINQELENRVLERTALLNSSNEELKLEIVERKRVEEELRTISNELEIRVENRTFELVNANRELEKAKKKADASALAKSEFLANMSHEIRNPMNAILGMADLAMNDRVHMEQRKKYLEIIKKSSQSLLVIINDVLDLSKIEAGKLELELQSFNVRDYVESVGDIFITEFNRKGLEYIIDIEDDVPYVAKGDPIRLQQVLLNLIGNAVKFTENGEICVKLTTGNVSKNNIELLFEVSDTGIGIDLNEQRNLFEAFSQGDGSITRKYGGTGLGLTICKRIINLMNGTIYVESDPGIGSAFKFSVVLERDMESIVETAYDTVEPLDILLVVHNPKLQNVCARILKSYGFYVTTVDNGTQAVHKISNIEKNRCFDLIVMDEDVPEQNCFEVLNAIQGIAPEFSPPVIMVGNVKNKDEINNLQAHGVSSYISKPLKSSTLFDSIIAIFKNVKTGLIKKEKQVYDQSKFKGMKILLVEDNPINQIVVTEILNLGGIDITRAENGLEAIDYIKQKEFDVVLMDVQMPKLDGIEATRIIREKLEKNVPIIAMTAHVMQGDRAKCIEAGMNDFISKPIERVKLFEILKRYFFVSNDKKNNGNQGDIDRIGVEFPGIDIDDGIQRLSCDHKVFSDILTNFCGFYNNIGLKLETLFLKGAYDDAVRELHSLKGAAINVSAVNLYIVSKEFESTLESDKGNTEFTKFLDDLNASFDEVCCSSKLLREHLAKS